MPKFNRRIVIIEQGDKLSCVIDIFLAVLLENGLNSDSQECKELIGESTLIPQEGFSRFVPDFLLTSKWRRVLPALSYEVPEQIDPIGLQYSIFLTNTIKKSVKTLPDLDLQEDIQNPLVLAREILRRLVYKMLSRNTDPSLANRLLPVFKGFGERFNVNPASNNTQFDQLILRKGKLSPLNAFLLWKHDDWVTQFQCVITSVADLNAHTIATRHAIEYFKSQAHLLKIHLIGAMTTKVKSSRCKALFIDAYLAEIEQKYSKKQKHNAQRNSENLERIEALRALHETTKKIIVALTNIDTLFIGIGWLAVAAGVLNIKEIAEAIRTYAIESTSLFQPPCYLNQEGYLQALAEEKSLITEARVPSAMHCVRAFQHLQDPQLHLALLDCFQDAIRSLSEFGALEEEISIAGRSISFVNRARLKELFPNKLLVPLPPSPPIPCPALAFSPPPLAVSARALSHNASSASLADGDLPEGRWLESSPDEQQPLLISPSNSALKKRKEETLCGSSWQPSAVVDNYFEESKEPSQLSLAEQLPPRERVLLSEETMNGNASVEDQKDPDVDSKFTLNQWEEKYLPIAHNLITYAKQKKHSELWRIFEVLLGPEHLNIKRETAEQLFSIDRALMVVKCKLAISKHLMQLAELEDTSHRGRMLYEAAVAHQKELRWKQVNLWEAGLSWILFEDPPLPDITPSLSQQYNQVCQSIRNGDFDIDDHIAFVKTCQEQVDILWGLSGKKGKGNLHAFHPLPRDWRAETAIDRYLRKRIEECIPSVMNRHAPLIKLCAQQAHQITVELSLRVAEKHVTEALRQHVLRHIRAFSRGMFKDTDSQGQRLPQIWLEKWCVIDASLVEEEYSLKKKRKALKRDMQRRLANTTDQYKKEALATLGQYVPDYAELNLLSNHPEKVVQEILECDIGNVAQASIIISSTKKTLLMYCIEEIQAALALEGDNRQRRLMYSAQILKTLCVHGAVALTAVDGKLPPLKHTTMARLVETIIKMAELPSSNLKETQDITVNLYQLLKTMFENIPVLSELAEHIRDFYYQHTHELHEATKAIVIREKGTWSQERDLNHKNKQLVYLASRASSLSYSASGTDQRALQGFQEVASGQAVPTRWYEWNSPLQQDAAKKIKRLEDSNQFIFSLLDAGYEEIQRLGMEQDAQAEKMEILEQNNQKLEKENQNLRQRQQKLKQENQEMKQENQEMKQGQQKLTQENQEMKQGQQKLIQENQEMRHEQQEMRHKHQEMTQQIAQLAQIVAQLQAGVCVSSAGGERRRPSFATVHGVFAAEEEEYTPSTSAAAQPATRRLSSAKTG
jgi:hypothetical protein